MELSSQQAFNAIELHENSLTDERNQDASACRLPVVIPLGQAQWKSIEAVMRPIEEARRNETQ
jgi:hypothetical protein